MSTLSTFLAQRATRAVSAVPRVHTGSRLFARAGVGLKREHFQDVLETRPDIGFFEVHAENYMVDGGPFHHFLGRIHEHYPLSLHGVGLSIGAEDPLDEAQLDWLDALIERYQTASFSEHLAWSSHGEVFFNDLLPVPYDRATLDRVCDHVVRVQERLQRQMLLDVNNVHVCCVNHGRDALAYITSLPLDTVGEIHLAGFATDRDAAAGAPLLIDSHGSPVDEAVWGPYAAVLVRTGPTPTLLQRDNDVPSLATLLAEAQRAEDLMPAPAEPKRCGMYWSCS